VGVGLLDAVAQDVPQPSGLGDFGDGVGDHPGLVAVAQPVERQPCGVPEVGRGSLTNGDRWSDMIPACRLYRAKTSRPRPRPACSP
jgi:hypothetical protein